MLPSAALSTHASSLVGKKYLFVPTTEVVDALMDEGWSVTSGNQVNSRKNAGFQRHVLRFEPTDASNRIIIGGALLQLMLVNSHDGCGAFMFGAGLFRFACANGMVVSDGEFQWLRARHRGTLDEILCSALDVADGLKAMVPKVRAMEAKELSMDSRRDFADRALALRFPDHRPVAAEQVLNCRRSEDDGASVWQTYNVIQENLCRGGMAGVSKTGRGRIVQGVRGVNADLRINSGLWEIAAGYV